MQSKSATSVETRSELPTMSGNYIPETMRALQLQKIGSLTEVQLPVPRPKPNEVLIKTLATTICTSDLNDINHNPFGVKYPRVLGHEGAGTIVSVGEDVNGFLEGDDVAAHPVISCHHCDNCQRDLSHLCSNLGHLGLDRDGTFAEYFCIPAECIRRIPIGIDISTGALLEPVAVCMEAIRRGRIRSGDAVLVVGDGPFGNIIARLVSSLNFGKVIVVGHHDFRLNQIPAAVTTINELSTPDLVEAIWVANKRAGVDVAILAVGDVHALDICINSLRARGRAVIFSAIASPVSLDLFSLHTKELEILGACNDHDLVDLALEGLGDRELLLSSLITHQIPFHEWSRAFELVQFGRDQALKVALTFSKNP